MNAELLRHAIETIWCNPAQDRQFTYQLRRLTPTGGMKNFFNLFYETVSLPTADRAYHVYQIGQVHPTNIGIPSGTRQWVSLSELAEDQLTLVDVHTVAGIQFPKFNTFVRLSANRNLIVAVPVNLRIVDLETETLYLRFYSNAFWVSQRSADKRYIYSRGMVVPNQTELLRFQRQLDDLVAARGGYPQYFVNGRFVSNISLVTAIEGDAVDFVLDGSIKRMVEFDIIDQPTFTSELDRENKYILHYEADDVNTIEYLDDVDVFLYQPGQSTRFMGTTYHRSEKHWLRMLTHRDYSISIPRLMSFIHAFPGDERVALDPSRFPENKWQSLANKKLRLYIRHAGYDRPLEVNANRIQQLYKLPSDRITRAMSGTDSTVDVWRAVNLEQSAYTTFMSLPPDKVYAKSFNRVLTTSEEKQDLQELVGDVYGYHAAATILAGTPSNTYLLNGFRYADLAPEHHSNATVFEYNVDGLLLGWYYHVAGKHYIAKNANTHRVEALCGKGSFRPTSVYGYDPVDIPMGYNYKLYVRPLWAGQPNGDWIDITELSNRRDYGFFDDVSIPNRWVWTYSPGTYQSQVRIDDSFLCYELSLTRGSGQLQFHINLEENIDGEWEENHCEIPFGQLDVLMNGKTLSEGLDFHVEWPRVVVFNLEYLNETPMQHFTVRAYGFTTSSFERRPPKEVGFVEYGVLSNNHHYDIHTNKILRVIVDGQYRAAEDVIFDETSGEFRMTDVRNGAPYSISHPATVFRTVYPSDEQARLKDQAIEDQVSNYMTEYFPTPERNNVDLIERPYRIFSPFAQKILHDLIEGWLYPNGIEGDYGSLEVRQWCKPYEWLLPFDPCNTDYDDVHIEIYPCWYPSTVSIDIYKYRFFQRVLKTYLRHPPDTAQFIKIS